MEEEKRKKKKIDFLLDKISITGALFKIDDAGLHIYLIRCSIKGMTSFLFIDSYGKILPNNFVQNQKVSKIFSQYNEEELFNFKKVFPKRHSLKVIICHFIGLKEVFKKKLLDNLNKASCN